MSQTSKVFLLIMSQTLTLLIGLNAKAKDSWFWSTRARAKEQRKPLRSHVTIKSAAKDFHDSLGAMNRSSFHKYHPHRHRAAEFQKLISTAMRVAHEESIDNSNSDEENPDPQNYAEDSQNSMALNQKDSKKNSEKKIKITAKTILDNIAKTGDYVMRGKEPGMLEMLEKCEIVKFHEDIMDHKPTLDKKTGESVMKQFPLERDHYSSEALQEKAGYKEGFPSTAHSIYTHSYKVTNIPIKFENYANIRYMELTATVMNVKDLATHFKQESGTNKGSGTKNQPRKLSEDTDSDQQGETKQGEHNRHGKKQSKKGEPNRRGKRESKKVEKEEKKGETVREARLAHKITQIKYALMNGKRETSSVVGIINVYTFSS